jgi:chromosome partitioning protein
LAEGPAQLFTSHRNQGRVAMRTVAIINQKGGCGKTTTSINLAACLARLGHKTLLIDMDPQGHCGVGLAVPEDQIERTIFDTLIDPADGRVCKLNEIIWQIATDFDLAPSNLRLAGFEQIFSGRTGREGRLGRVLEQAKPTYRWCVIDCPPSVGLITFNALFACDEVLVPVETGFFSLHGLTKMMETLEEMKEKCNKDVILRVLPTLYDTRTKLAREVLSELRAKFKDYLMESTVNFNTKLKEAASFGQPITEYDPGSRGYKDFVNLARELMGHRPVDVEPTPTEPMSRPAELVQRAKQLAQFAQYQFGQKSESGGLASPGYFTTPNQGGVAIAASPSIRTLASTPAVAAAPAKTTQQKIDEFYGVRQLGTDVVFAARFEKAKQVLIAGDFNAWSGFSTPMQSRGEAGEWTMTLPLRPGRYRYRFVVDGKWVTDPFNARVERNQYGELDNVVEVK